LLLVACRRADPPLTGPFSDDFARADLGDNYVATGPGFTVESGVLVGRNVRNHPLWLKRTLPENVEITFDAISHSPDGDIKVEVYGDGRSFESDASIAANQAYVTTSYVFIFGGWKNSRSVLARLEEHQAGAPARTDVKVVPGQRYQFRIVRRGGKIDWFLDGAPFLSLEDKLPLSGKGHDHFGFTGWQAEVHFDNLRITPL
jgi:hypothetical protein